MGQPQVSAGTAARRAGLLDAADRVIRRYGPESSMNAIAAEAGVTKPILYRHFGDKGGLYRAVAERHVDDLRHRLRAAQGTPGGLRAVTWATIDAYLTAIEELPEVYRFLVHRASLEEPGVRGQVASFVQQLGEELARGIRAQLGLEPDDPVASAWAHGIVGMVQNAGDWWLEHRSVSREVLAEQLTDLLWGAFARPRRKGRP